MRDTRNLSRIYHVVNADADEDEGEDLSQSSERNACRGLEQERRHRRSSWPLRGET